MAGQYNFVADLAAEADMPEHGIHSQTLMKEEGFELVLFAMARGEQLSEHTSARQAIVHVLSGEGQLNRRWSQLRAEAERLALHAAENLARDRRQYASRLRAVPAHSLSEDYTRAPPFRGGEGVDVRADARLAARS